MTDRFRKGLRPILRPDALRGRDGKPYHAHPDLLAAANVSLTLGRPLLLTGEAGCGKTDFAFAAAHALAPHAGDAEEHPAFGEDEGGLLESHVRSDSLARDLLYHYDALRRFDDAHHGDEQDRKRARDVRDYIRLLPLGQALVSTRLRVVLIDEIDKAPRDLPNDLLRELDHGRFEIPEIPRGAPSHASGLERVMGRAKEDPSRPFVVITSNVERQLPDAFLRRCVFFHIRFPEKDDLKKILVDRFGEEAPFCDQAIDVFIHLREVAREAKLTKQPGTAELLDWGRALSEVFAPAHAQRSLSAFLAEAKEEQDRRKLPWKDLPGLCCLVKLREDLGRLRVA